MTGIILGINCGSFNQLALKIGILSFRPISAKSAPEEILLQKDARAKGHIAKIFRSDKFKLVYDKKTPFLIYDGKPFPKYDVVIARASVLRDADLKTVVIKQMEMQGILLFNKHEPILKAKNKIVTMQILDHFGIPIPRTVVINRPEDMKAAARLVGGFPLIVKHAFGSFGSGVFIVESMRALKSFLLWKTPVYILQEYVKESKGKDLRVFVVNGQVVGSMMRSARKGEFRSNVELGGKTVAIEVTEEEKQVAIRCAAALDLGFAGVDIMRSKNGPVVLEVNANPGFKALQRTTGINIAGTLIDYAVELAERR